MKIAKLGLAVSVVFVLAAVLQAQIDLSTIRGAASDASGSAVPGAKITLTNLETNISRDAVSTSDGVYEIPYLAPGAYRLTATSQGFKTFIAGSTSPASSPPTTAHSGGYGY